ncbi:MAG: SIMPL domain-containing protein [Bacillota bacterium]|jgi:uncharacterized protein YggE
MFSGRVGTVLLAGGVLLVLAFSLVSTVPKPVVAQDAALRLITVTGEAQTQVKPDSAIAQFGVENMAQTAQEAQRYNAQKMTEVVNALVASGVAKDDIQTSNFSLYPQYEWQERETGSKQVLVGFRCNNTVSVKVRNISKLGDIIDAAANAGANSIGGISFGLEDSEAVKNRMLAEAVKNARAKANVMAEAAGVTIIGVHSMSDGQYWVRDQVQAESIRGVYDMAKVSTPIEPGNLTISASVRMEFKF